MVTTAGRVAAAETAEQRLSRSVGRRGTQAAGAVVRELFAEHGRMVLGLCRLLLRDPDEAEDAAQQVFLSAHQALVRGSLPRDRAAWIAAIARNECRARIRARMREPLSLPELPSDLPDPLLAAIRGADLDAVWAALRALPRRQRNALVLRELGGLSYHELGRALGISHSAVESLLFRARQQVRGMLAGAHAAVPVALRDQLAQLIPGFDPSSAGTIARVASLPVALKLAGAAVGVGVVAAGGGDRHRTQSAVAPPPPHVVVRVDAPTRARHVVHREAGVVEHDSGGRGSGREIEPRRDENRGPARGSEGEGKAPGRTEDHSGSGGSGGSAGRDGGSGGHSGPG
ncbi:MAG TPA: sigma-70 family RNA polymerase sigma factor [Gaiellaceae bacterium]|nr:sigma-70 family RNA polymerase sigma factor [Gaiellaceae bacterium]